MASSFPGRPKLLKGALVELTEPFLGPVPRIVLFQYNPESMTRRLAAHDPSTEGDAGSAESSATAQPFDPAETIRIDTLKLHAADDLEDPLQNPVAVISGVDARIAALEKFLYPTEASRGGSLSVSVGASLSAGGGGVSGGASLDVDGEEASRPSVPIVLFVWGPKRILPVRITDFSVSELHYSPSLSPVHADVSLEMGVLRKEALEKEPENEAAAELAVAAYEFTRKQRDALATAQTAGDLGSLLGMLPF